MIGTDPRRPAQAMNSLFLHPRRMPAVPSQTARGLPTKVRARNNRIPCHHRSAHWWGKTSRPIIANMQMLATVNKAEVKLATPCLWTNGRLPITWPAMNTARMPLAPASSASP